MFDLVNGFLGLSTMSIIAAMINGNGGMYAALTAQYGSRSDTAAIAVLSLNDESEAMACRARCRAQGLSRQGDRLSGRGRRGLRPDSRAAALVPALYEDRP